MAVDIVSVTLRALGFAALFQAAGLAFFLTLFGWELSRPRPGLRRLGAVAAIAGVLLILAHLALDAARMAGDFSGLWDGELQRLAWISGSGTAALVQAAGLLGIALSLRRPGGALRSDRPRRIPADRSYEHASAAPAPGRAPGIAPARHRVLVWIAGPAPACDRYRGTAAGRADPGALLRDRRMAGAADPGGGPEPGVDPGRQSRGASATLRSAADRQDCRLRAADAAGGGQPLAPGAGAGGWFASDRAAPFDRDGDRPAGGRPVDDGRADDLLFTTLMQERRTHRVPAKDAYEIPQLWAPGLECGGDRLRRLGYRRWLGRPVRRGLHRGAAPGARPRLQFYRHGAGLRRWAERADHRAGA